MQTVLVVDDEAPIRELLVRYIAGAGYQVRTAESAMDALDDMRVVAADIVVCDVRMPGETGLWLTAQLRSEFPRTAIVLATSDTAISPQITLQPGVVEYLAKPYTREEVLAAVRAAAIWHVTAVSERGRPSGSASLRDWIRTPGN